MVGYDEAVYREVLGKAVSNIEEIRILKKSTRQWMKFAIRDTRIFILWVLAARILWRAL